MKIKQSTRLLVNLSTNCFYCFFLQAVVRRDVCSQTLETCLQMNICTYHIARRASAYKWFFLVFFYNHYPYKKKKIVPCCHNCLKYKKRQHRQLVTTLFSQIQLIFMKEIIHIIQICFRIKNMSKLSLNIYESLMAVCHWESSTVIHRQSIKFYYLFSQILLLNNSLSI